VEESVHGVIQGPISAFAWRDRGTNMKNRQHCSRCHVRIWTYSHQTAFLTICLREMVFG